MNDRFKFRVWDKANEIFVENADIFYLEPNGEIVIGFYDGDIEDMRYASQDNIIIEQCTGLKDKNGNLIYEGDIVDTFYVGEPTGQRYIYHYEPPAFYVEPFEHGKPSGGHYYYFAVDNERCEIIGNIHENGDLLK